MKVILIFIEEMKLELGAKWDTGNVNIELNMDLDLNIKTQKKDY